MYPINLVNDCNFQDIYSEDEIYNIRNTNRLIHIKDKLLITNSIGQIFLGIADTTDLSPKCSNSIMYLEPASSSSGSNSLNYVIPCDGTNPSQSFSRFLLAKKDDTIINIGLECSEADISCLNTYFTIYSISAYPFKYKLLKTKVIITPSKVKFFDAILSLDEQSIHFLVNYGAFSKALFAIASLDLKNIGSIKQINANAVPDIIFPLSCEKIHEYSLFHFVLHCISIEFSSGYASQNPCCSYQKEIIYFIEQENDVFVSKFYFDLYEEKYLKIRSFFKKNEGNYLSISGTQFFTMIFPDLFNAYSISNSRLLNMPMIINGISFIDGVYLYPGCLVETLGSNYRSIIYSFDLY